ncbi:MAG: ScyD/ScyE family protein [Bryobacterales bacterium]|nr:ScyD/ScyE family protein [Bryobacterales bacterium]
MFETRTKRYLCLLAGLALPAAIGFAQESSVVVSGLNLPYKLVLTEAGNLLVSEGGGPPNSGRISLVTRSGARTSVIEGMPSGESNPELVPIGPTGLALRGRTLYIAMGEGDSLRNGATPGSLVLNPAGVSSPLFHCVLRVRFDANVDSIREPFMLAAAQHQQIADGWEVVLENASKQHAMIDLMAAFPVVTSDPNITYRHSDPFALAFGPERPSSGLRDTPESLYVVDAGQNSIVRLDTSTGRSRVIARFPPTKNPTSAGPPMVDSVPTGAVVVGNQILVSMLSGFPFVPGQARVMAVNLPSGTIDPWINLLTSATDIGVRVTAAGEYQYLVLGFSDNMSATPPRPGRLTLYTNPVGQVLVDSLAAPTGIAIDQKTGEVFIAEFGAGRISKVTIP